MTQPEHDLPEHRLRDAAAQKVNAVLTPERKKMLQHEVREIISVAIYLSFCFCFLATIRCLVLIQHGISEFGHSYVVAIVEGVALAKVVVLAQKLHVLAAWENRALALSTLWKAVIMTVIVSLCAQAEERMFHHMPAHVIHPTIFFIAHQLAFLLVFIVLFAVRELDHELGAGRLFKLCFGPRVHGLPPEQSLQK